MTIQELKRRLKEISHLYIIGSLLSWDKEVNMPVKGGDIRAASTAELSGIIHNKFVAIDSDGLLTRLYKQVKAKKIKGKDAVVILETWRGFEREKKLPESFVRELAEITSKSQSVWAEARAKNDFNMFLPWLSKIVSLKQQEAKLVGSTGSPYDALLDVFEPGMTTQEASVILNDLKEFLIPFIKKIKNSNKEIIGSKTKGKFPIDKQAQFNAFIAGSIGFDFNAGRIDKSVHPFTSGAHPHDVRITTRYKEDDLMCSLGSTIHETGHALYEQGLPVEHFGNPLSEAVSFGIHESQSRMWEKQIGKSMEFWTYFYPKLQKEFLVPFKKLPLKEFYKIINEVKPSLIRTESDEVTYNLHIIIRFEIEKEMIEGSIDLKDLPDIWRSKVNNYLGIDVPSNSLGVLQDVHWSGGAIGYFPSYSFGNLYAAQFYASMKKDIPNLKGLIKKGKFEEINKWLRKNIHSHGKTYKAGELVKKITGENLNSRYFTDYIEQKYTDIYSL